MKPQNSSLESETESFIDASKCIDDEEVDVKELAEQFERGDPEHERKVEKLLSKFNKKTTNPTETTQITRRKPLKRAKTISGHSKHSVVTGITEYYTPYTGCRLPYVNLKDIMEQQKLAELLAAHIDTKHTTMFIMPYNVELPTKPKDPRREGCFEGQETASTKHRKHPTHPHQKKKVTHHPKSKNTPPIVKEHFHTHKALKAQKEHKTYVHEFTEEYKTTPEKIERDEDDDDIVTSHQNIKDTESGEENHHNNGEENVTEFENPDYGHFSTETQSDVKESTEKLKNNQEDDIKVGTEVIVDQNDLGEPDYENDTEKTPIKSNDHEEMEEENESTAATHSKIEEETQEEKEFGNENGKAEEIEKMKGDGQEITETAEQGGEANEETHKNEGEGDGHGKESNEEQNQEGSEAINHGNKLEEEQENGSGQEEGEQETSIEATEHKEKTPETIEQMNEGDKQPLKEDQQTNEQKGSNDHSDESNGEQNQDNSQNSNPESKEEEEPEQINESGEKDSKEGMEHQHGTTEQLEKPEEQINSQSEDTNEESNEMKQQNGMEIIEGSSAPTEENEGSTQNENENGDLEYKDDTNDSEKTNQEISDKNEHSEYEENSLEHQLTESKEHTSREFSETEEESNNPHLEVPGDENTEESENIEHSKSESEENVTQESGEIHTPEIEEKTEEPGNGKHDESEEENFETDGDHELHTFATKNEENEESDENAHEESENKEEIEEKSHGTIGTIENHTSESEESEIGEHEEGEGKSEEVGHTSHPEAESPNKQEQIESKEQEVEENNEKDQNIDEVETGEDLTTLAEGNTEELNSGEQGKEWGEESEVITDHGHRTEESNEESEGESEKKEEEYTGESEGTTESGWETSKEDESEEKLDEKEHTHIQQETETEGIEGIHPETSQLEEQEEDYEGTKMGGKEKQEQTESVSEESTIEANENGVETEQSTEKLEESDGTTLGESKEASEEEGHSEIEGTKETVEEQNQHTSGNEVEETNAEELNTEEKVTTEKEEKENTDIDHVGETNENEQLGEKDGEEFSETEDNQPKASTKTYTQHKEQNNGHETSKSEKHTPKHQFNKIVPAHEVVEYEDVGHFPHHETSTICEICETHMNTSEGHHNHGPGTTKTGKHTPKHQFNKIVPAHEVDEDEDIGHFPHHETSTICELCGTSKKHPYKSTKKGKGHHQGTSTEGEENDYEEKEPNLFETFTEGHGNSKTRKTTKSHQKTVKHGESMKPPHTTARPEEAEENTEENSESPDTKFEETEKTQNSKNHHTTNGKNEFHSIITAHEVAEDEDVGHFTTKSHEKGTHKHTTEGNGEETEGMESTEENTEKTESTGEQETKETEVEKQRTSEEQEETEENTTESTENEGEKTYTTEGRLEETEGQDETEEYEHSSEKQEGEGTEGQTENQENEETVKHSKEQNENGETEEYEHSSEKQEGEETEGQTENQENETVKHSKEQNENGETEEYEHSSEKQEGEETEGQTENQENEETEKHSKEYEHTTEKEEGEETEENTKNQDKQETEENSDEQKENQETEEYEHTTEKEGGEETQEHTKNHEKEKTEEENTEEGKTDEEQTSKEHGENEHTTELESTEEKEESDTVSTQVPESTMESTGEETSEEQSENGETKGETGHGKTETTKEEENETGETGAEGHEQTTGKYGQTSEETEESEENGESGVTGHSTLSESAEESNKTQPNSSPEKNESENHTSQMPTVIHEELGSSNGSEAFPSSTSGEIYISLPILYPNSSETVENFEKFYSVETTTVIVDDDENTDVTLDLDELVFKKMSDFNAITEFPMTTEGEEAFHNISGDRFNLSSQVNATNPEDEYLRTSHHFQETVPTEGTVAEVLDEIEIGLETTVVLFPTEESKEGPESFNAHQTDKLETEEEWDETTSPGPSMEDDDFEQPTKKPIIVTIAYSFEHGNKCHIPEHRNESCLCSVERVLAKLLQNSWNGSICDEELHHVASIVIGNSSVPKVRRRRSSDNYKEKKEIVKNNNIEDALQNVDLLNTPEHFYATPGGKVEMPCLLNGESPEHKVSWTSANGKPLTEGKVEEIGGSLSIENIVPQDGGNYTCLDGPYKINHELSIVTIPNYVVSSNVLYGLKEKCTKEDSDILALYLPNIIEHLLCGNSTKICTIDVKNTYCHEEHKKNYLGLSLRVIIEPLDILMPNYNKSACDLNCQMKMYTTIVGTIIKNTEKFEKIPVYYRLTYRNIELLPTDVQHPNRSAIIKKKNIGSEAPKLIISCIPGFGLKRNVHICAACPKNTYSTGDASYCVRCPSGEYQPEPGSKSCLLCKSPLDDPECLSVIYHGRTLRFYAIIIAIALVLLLVFFCCYMICSETKQTCEPKRAKLESKCRRRQCRMRDYDVEQQDVEPLVGRTRRKNKSDVPKPPPPDF